MKGWKPRVWRFVLPLDALLATSLPGHGARSTLLRQETISKQLQERGHPYAQRQTRACNNITTALTIISGPFNMSSCYQMTSSKISFLRPPLLWTSLNWRHEHRESRCHVSWQGKNSSVCTTPLYCIIYLKFRQFNFTSNILLAEDNTSRVWNTNLSFHCASFVGNIAMIPIPFRITLRPWM